MSATLGLRKIPAVRVHGVGLAGKCAWAKTKLICLWMSIATGNTSAELNDDCRHTIDNDCVNAIAAIFGIVNNIISRSFVVGTFKMYRRIIKPSRRQFKDKLLGFLA